MKNKMDKANAEATISLHKKGIQRKEIAKELNVYPSSVLRVIMKYEQEATDQEYFNVNKYECWVSPVTSHLPGSPNFTK